MNRAFKLMTIAVSVAAGGLWLNIAHAASFDCAKAHTKIEHQICANPKLSKLDEKLAKAYAAATKQTSEERRISIRRQERRWLVDRDKCANDACLIREYKQRIAALNARPAYANAARSPSSHRILGHYVAQGVPWSASLTIPVASVCKTLVANFNEFRDVPFESNQPRLSPKYPQFRRIWKPMAWNRTLAKSLYIPCTSEACVKKGEPAWRFWLNYTKPLREAGRPLLWRARVDLLGDGRHETLIRLTHIFGPKVIHGKLVPVPPSNPYSRYFDSMIHMLPSPYPKMAKIFNNGPMSGLEYPVTDIIQDVGDKNVPYLALAWSRRQAGIGVSYFEPSQGPFPYDFQPLCDIRWVPRGE